MVYSSNINRDIWVHIESTKRALKSSKIDLDNGYYEWALYKIYVMISTLLHITGEMYDIPRSSDMVETFKNLSATCGGPTSEVGRCITTLIENYRKCVGPYGVPITRVSCSLECTLESLRCGKIVTSWVEQCIRDAHS